VSNVQTPLWWLVHDLEERHLLVEIIVGSTLAVNHDQVLALQAQLKEIHQQSVI